jgi:hypothetical protein
MLTIAVLLGLANWIATTIIVESELFRPLRDRLAWEADRAYRPFGSWRFTVLSKLQYLVGCHLCTGTWVALIEACFVTLGLSSGLPGIVLSALVFKAIGHTALNVNARLAP